MSKYSTALSKIHQRPIAFYPVHAEIMGSAEGGLVLSQLCYWQSTKEGEEFYKKDDEIMQETMVKERAFLSIKSKLKKMPFIRIELKGLPRKTFYRIDFDILINYISEVTCTPQTSVTGNPQTSVTGNRHLGGTITETTPEITTESSCSLSSSLRSSDKESVHPADEPCEKEILKPKKKVKREEYPPEFEVLWYHYPSRQKCPNPKKDAYLKCKSRLKEGTTWQEMMLALSAYDEYVTDEDIGPEYIKQGRTFFGGGGHIEEWLEKVDKEEANTILLRYRLYVAKVKAGEDIEPIFPGDWEKYGIDRNEDYEDD